MNNHFQLNERLAADCIDVVDLPLCRVLLMNDARYPWLVLVPRVPDLSDLNDLDRDQQLQLLDEIHRTNAALRQMGTYDRINVAALGNVVSQLHVHVVARRRSDFAWPAPVWGQGEAEPYANPVAVVQQIRLALE